MTPVSIVKMTKACPRADDTLVKGVTDGAATQTGELDMGIDLADLRRREAVRLLAAGSLGAATVPWLAGTARAQTPKRGGSIRAAGYSSSTADTVDPAKQAFSTDYARCNMFYNTLTRLDGALAPQPELAETIANDKATVWTLKLRKGVTFHDGKPLTAADVVYSLSRHLDPAVGSIAKPLAQQMTEIKATAADEVRITLASPNADFPVVLGTFHFHIIKDGTKDFTTAIGTGPYKCKEFQPGVHTVAVRNENYWKPGKPYLDQIDFFGIPDETARINALLAGDIQLAGGLTPRSTRRIKGQPGFVIFETPAGVYTDLIVRLDAPSTGNVDFALTLKYLMDREQMRDAIWQGFATIGNDHPVSPSNRFYNADLPQRKFDPDRAKFHFQKSGVGTSAIPIVVSPAAEGSAEMAVMLQDAGAKFGLNLDVRRVPADGYWSNYWLKSPVGFGNINPRPSLDILLSLFFRSDAPWNESAFKDPKFDQLLLAARGETDQARRKQMYGDMQHMISDTAGIGIPLFNSYLDGHSANLKGLEPIPVGGMMGYDFAENVWLDG
jgi:peptide/nickel transport system substrate-binding protein